MAVLSATALLPDHASAFWPFSTNADAATSALIPSSSTPTLRAPLNSNPNSSAPIALATSGGSALVSYNGPDGTVADVAGSVQTDRISVYVVRNGDTLSEISDMFGVSINTILWANNLKSSRDVHPGDMLVILPISGVERTVIKGDTLKSLAKKYSADAEEIAQYNGLDLEAPLAIGTTIIIPGGEIAAPAPRPQSSPAIVNSGGGTFIAGYFSNPVPGARVTQGIHGKNGIDLGGARGTPVHAAADGMIIIARGGGAWNGGYGNYIVITHNNGTQTLYSHLKSVIVSSGQQVSSGQVIGYMGSTGKVTGVHLHFEVRGAANPFRNCSVGSVCSPQ
ncbi:MAG: M23 family metallopeptidase [Candidatus Paceibacterota bacterium]